MASADLSALNGPKGFYQSIFNFQDNRSAPLATTSHWVVPEKYIGHYMRIRNGYCSERPAFDGFNYRQHTTPMRVAALNLSKKSDIEQIRDFTKHSFCSLSQEFSAMTGRPLSVLGHIVGKDYYNQEDLLICFPHKINMDDWKIIHDPADSKVVSQFFAFLWQKGLITEEQLYDSPDVMLGPRHREILELTHDFARSPA